MNINDCKKFEPIFDSWYVKSELGHGSFGSVFEIQKQEFGVTYTAALKVMSIPQDDDEIRKMRLEGSSEESIRKYFDNVARDIVNELVIMNQLKGNSNIVSYEDHTVIRHEDGIGYDLLMRMELLEPLVAFKAKHHFSEKDVVKLGIDLCKGLELCEKYNIIHRDIKPENIFVAQSGNYKLGDFGIARTIEKTSSDLSRKGTYSYMAPELYKGMQYGQTVDIYSLGIVMYTMLNGTRVPFLPPLPAEITAGDKEKALHRRFAGEPIPAINGVNSNLMKVIQTACAYNPANRFQSAAQMRKALETADENYQRDSFSETEYIDYSNDRLNAPGVPPAGAAPVYADFHPPRGDADETETLIGEAAAFGAGAAAFGGGPYDGAYGRSGSYGSGSYGGGSYGGSGSYGGGSGGYGQPPYGGGPQNKRGKRKLLPIIIGAAAVVLLAIGVFAVMGMLKSDDDSVADKHKNDDALATIFFATDYAGKDDDRSIWDPPRNTLYSILNAADSDGKSVDKVIMIGDYNSKDGGGNYILDPGNAIDEIKSVAQEVNPDLSNDDFMFTQGNVESWSSLLTGSKQHEEEDYIVYVLNAEKDFPCWQGEETKNGSLDTVRKASDELREYLNELIDNNEKRPVIIACHVPLHFTGRVSKKTKKGDNLYASLVFDVLNEAGKDLDILFVFGHNCSRGWDCYLGGSTVFKAVGDTILIPEYEEGEETTDKYAERKLNFTYLNGGYIGYYMNCGRDAYEAGRLDEYHAADEALTGTVCEIYNDDIVLTRYDVDGVHPLCWDGEADPYDDDGYDDYDLIKSEYYSTKIESPQIVERKNEGH